MLAAVTVAALTPPAAAARGDGEAHASAAIAVAQENVHVRAGVARLIINCHNAPCRGVVKLVAQLSRPSGSERRALIGSKAFTLPGETERALFVNLNREGRRLMRRVKRSGRYILLEGPGLRHRTVILKPVRDFPRRLAG
ncbi:MAG TPA: hypothetical protein VHF50_01410 [Solirubrobacterales bacterium]|nr:hypothetical protein [Solirubrobacterales bacterium]